MNLRLLLAIGAGVLAVTPAGAQTPPPAADNAAMERALQQADGPKRRIIEAARLKAAPGAPAAAAPAPAATAAPASATAAPRPRAPEPEPVVIVTLPAADASLPTLPSAAFAAVPTIAAPELVTQPPAMGDWRPPPALNPATLPPPKLVKMVEPAVPPRAARRAGRNLELRVDITIETDGSVSEVVVRQPENFEFSEALVDALRQWRYEPQPVARPHRLQLVLLPQ